MQNLNPVQKSTQMRIQRALSQPGAVGMKGFLLWTEAAWPPAISQKILQAASRYTPGAGTTPGAFTPALASPASGGFGRLGLTEMRPYVHRGRGNRWGRMSMGAFGDSTDGITVDLTAIPDTVSQAISDASTPPPPSATTVATPSQPASASWLSDMSQAIQAASVATLGVVQAKDAQTIFQTNLARAQQGLPMIPTNPTQYGLPAPTANIGLTSGAQTTIFIGVGLLAVGLIAAGAFGGRGKH